MNEETTGEDNAADLPVHAVLGGKYELVDVLGTGATFTVYEAQRVAAPAVPEPTPDDDAEAADAEAADADDAVAEAAGSDPDADAEADDSAGADATAEIAEPGEPAEPEIDPDLPLVVKVLHPHLVDDQSARASLRREVEASALVTHPGVVKVLDSGEEEVAGASVPWTVMNRMAGVSLSDFAGDSGVPWRDALAIIDGLLEALAAVHAAGLVHRDVAPRNVMVDKRPDGTFVVGLLDLGLTRPAGGEGDGATVAGSVIGMSPEQARGKPLDARSDIYAVGALAYYTLTGHAPYERAQAEDVLRAHVNAPVPAASARRAAVPASVDRLVSRAMAKDPGRRFPTAEAMRGTVTILLGGPAGRMGTSGETMQLGVGAGGTEVIDPVAGAAGSGTMKLGQVAEGGDRTTVVGAIGAAGVAAAGVAGAEAAAASGPPVGPPPVGPPPVGPPAEERKWWHAMTTGRGRVATVIVFALLVFGGAGLVIANILDDGPPPEVNPSVSPSSQAPSRTPSSSPTPSQTDDEEDDFTPLPSSTPSPTPTPSATPTPSPTPTPTPTATPTPDPEPTPTVTVTEEPTPTPTVTVTEEPTGEPTDGGEAGGDPSAPAAGSR
ncbi:serine/threonine-protein kinase [Promicromonospora soli]|uniref:serine/threonine-protein kinase n=1 Tax=Promicromonospora soli TaxID=2035533 RepID=UPI00167BE0C4|nr:serine/threonine-protein kinase [Promicromonospora soli]